MDTIIKQVLRDRRFLAEQPSDERLYLPGIEVISRCICMNTGKNSIYMAKSQGDIYPRIVGQ